MLALLLTAACSGEAKGPNADGDAPSANNNTKSDEDGDTQEPASTELDPNATGTDTDAEDSKADAAGSTDDTLAQNVPPIAQAGAPFLAPRSFATRLTQAELNNTLYEILGDDTSPGTRFLAEDEFAPFDNDVSRQTVSQALVDSLAILAEDVAARAVGATERDRWMPCQPTTVTDVDCFDQTTQVLARSFFRRPLPRSEAERYRVLLDYAEEQADFFAAVELLLTSFLQDPEFLYRLERGQAGAEDGILELDAHEVATRLSFLLFGSGPSSSLLDQADSGALLAPDARRVTAQAMLDDERARRQLYRFHAMWLGYRTLPNSAELNTAFQRETEHLIERTVFDEPQSYLNLFLSPDTFVTGELAAHYGIGDPDQAEGWVTYPEGSQRAGILGHGSILAAFSKFTDTSPTQRGIFVRTRLMCLDVPPPPPTVDVDQPPGGAMDTRCKLDRYAAHREQSGCAECHNLFDPIGVGLENFDIQGRHRDSDDADPSCVIDGLGTLPGVADFRGPQELSELLVESDLISECVVRHYLEFALAKGSLSEQEQAYASSLTQDFQAADHRLDALLLGYVTSEAFIRKVEEL
jgi:hypothetical protein